MSSPNTDTKSTTERSEADDTQEQYRYVCALILMDTYPRFSRDIAKLIASYSERHLPWMVTICNSADYEPVIALFNCKEDAEHCLRDELYEWGKRKMLSYWNKAMHEQLDDALESDDIEDMENAVQKVIEERANHYKAECKTIIEWTCGPMDPNDFRWL